MYSTPNFPRLAHLLSLHPSFSRTKPSKRTSFRHLHFPYFLRILLPHSPASSLATQPHHYRVLMHRKASTRMMLSASFPMALPPSRARPVKTQWTCSASSSRSAWGKARMNPWLSRPLIRSLPGAAQIQAQTAHFCSTAGHPSDLAGSDRLKWRKLSVLSFVSEKKQGKGTERDVL